VAKYSAQLVANSSENKKVTTTLSNVNPETAPIKIKQFAQTLNALTTNTYNETNYIVTTNLDTETPPVDTRPTPTISIENVPTLEQLKSGSVSSMAMITYSGDGVTYVRRNSGCNAVYFGMSGAPYQGQQAVVINKLSTAQASDVTGGTYVVGATGTDNYKPVEVEYTLQ